MTPAEFKGVLADNLRELMSSSPVNNDGGIELNHFYYGLRSNTAIAIYKGEQNRISSRFKICMARDLPRYDNMRIKWVYLTLLYYTNMLGDKPCMYVKVGPQYNNDNVSYKGTHVLSLFRFEEDSFTEEGFLVDVFKWMLMLFPAERALEIFKEMDKGYYDLLEKHQDELIEAAGAQMENRMIFMRFAHENFKKEEEGIFRL